MTNHNDLVVGNDLQITLPDGRKVRSIYFDNGASTPPLKSVLDKVLEFLPYYSSIHRGSGFKARLASEIFEESRRIMHNFVHAPSDSMVAFSRNTTEAINLLAHYVRELPGEEILIAHSEHHANDLPWRQIGRVVRIPVNNNGDLDLDYLADYVRKNRNKIKFASFVGASNVTGTVTPIRETAQILHEQDILFHVDAAQLAPHKTIDMSNQEMDFLSISGHKMYAPFGSGILAGPKEFFSRKAPMIGGGGCIDFVTDDEVIWTEPPERLEAGTPNVIGSVAIAAAAVELQRLSFPVLEKAEEELTQYLLQEMERVPGLTIIGHGSGWEPSRRLGVISFALMDIPFELVTAVLEYEYGISTRGGCFCAHPFIIKVLGMDDAAIEAQKARIAAGDHTHRPGLTRISLGLFNTREEAKVLVDALHHIARRDLRFQYRLNPATGAYYPPETEFRAQDFFRF